MADKKRHNQSDDEFDPTIYRDFKLSDGTEVHIDEYKMSRKEFHDFYNLEMEDEDQVKLFSRITGVPFEKLNHISFMDWRLIVQNFRTLIERPLTTDIKN